jgi:hypothetical protein
MLARMAGALGASGPVAPAFATAGPAAPPRPASEPVSFRRDGRIPRVVPWSPPAPDASAVAPAPIAVPARGGPTPSPHAARRIARAAAAAPAAGAARAVSYASARRLLKEGLDREAIRDRTGLRLAEIDLLRCAAGDGS